MKKVVLFGLLILLSLISFYVKGETPPQTQNLFFQSLTLLPGSLLKLDLPAPITDIEGHIGILVTADGKITSRFIHQPTKRSPSNDRDNTILRVVLYTDKGRTLPMKPKVPDPNDISDKAVFLSGMRLKKNESINKIGLVANKQITLLKIEWFEQFAK